MNTFIQESYEKKKEFKKPEDAFEKLAWYI